MVAFTLKDVGVRRNTQLGVGGGGWGESKEEKFKWEPSGSAWPLIKNVSRLGYIMSLIICMTVVRKCTKSLFTHSP
jgi:hypothetical protein